MQRRDLTLGKEQAAPQLFSLLTLVTSITTYLARMRWVAVLTDLYSLLLGKKFTTRQTVYILYAQICLMLAFLPFSLNLGWRMLFLVWFYQAICRSGLIRLFKNDV